MELVLASASPARRRLLQGIGINPIVHVSNFDEDQIKESDPARLVEALALAKAETVAKQRQNALILGCDSVLLVQGEILGKPESPAEAIARWQSMRGSYGVLYTGHALVDQNQQRTLVRHGMTKVHFAKIDDATIKAYVASEEPLQCAGCFALEGKGGLFIEKLEGCHSNVIGLSLPLLRKMFVELGHDISKLWS
ncbi:Septum formation protein Maf [[Leptolyngbya] sp. PCC 7376]|uniref:Maf family protein n=1 Tax=[Leptolyngbya] sp. PCC 7376 TaxID=111781 RepID=UPI00029F4684|nr:nucleoside triphosphate pyrophosphatase [[Leptolyngbya] sp. PCC 7376]AFY37165.1 Septum formation protein Maf [[Leptolyngbya] sp. PCC 7376]